MSRLSQVVFWLFVVTLAFVATVPSALAQQGRLVGSVVDSDDNPLPDVAIKAENPDAAQQTLFEATTDNSGRFSLIGFASGRWTVTASLEGYIVESFTATIRQVQTAPVNFVLARIPHPLVAALGQEALSGLDPDEIEADLQAADAALNAQDWPTALEGYHLLLGKLPMLTGLYLQIGNAHRGMGDYEQSLTAYETLLVEDPNNQDVRREMATTRLAMGDLDAATEEFEAAASGLDAGREDLYNLGELEFARGAIDVAKEWYEKAAMVDPNWELPLFKLALVALNQGDIASAKEYFQRVVDVAPDSAEGTQAQATLNALP
jgi:tetratricopeptide (TPR) repeat protein